MVAETTGRVTVQKSKLCTLHKKAGPFLVTSVNHTYVAVLVSISLYYKFNYRSKASFSPTDQKCAACFELSVGLDLNAT